MKRFQDWNEKRKRVLAIGVFALLIVIMLATGYLAGMPMMRIVTQAAEFRQWVRQHELEGRMAYIAIVILQVVFAVIPGEPLEILGGYVFGAVGGTLLYLGAATVGSLIVFGLVRRFGVRLVKIFFPLEKLRSLYFLQKSPKRTFLFWIVFMIPGTPKDLLCYYAGLTDIRLPIFFIICSIGRLPALITSTIGGSAMETHSYLFAAVLFGITLVLSGAGLLIYERICQSENHADRHE